jgi:hypothetical protein
LQIALPEPLDQLLTTRTALLDRRHAELLRPLFLGSLLAHGRRTATAWFRAGDFAADFRRGYTLLGTLGRSQVQSFAAFLFHYLRRTLDPGPRWLFALDDSPTPRYGPCVAGAGLHHHPTPGPSQQRYVYGHVWVTLAWVVRHPLWHVLALPLLADLYIRQDDLPKIDADRRPAVRTKLEQAAEQLTWTAQQLRGRDRPLWFVIDGAYPKRPVLRRARREDAVVVGRLRRAAALWDVPPAVPPGQRGRGRPRT